MRKLRYMLLLLMLFMPAARSEAAPILYNFTGTVTESVNGNNTVTGMFTLDAAVGNVTAFSFSHPGGVFDSSNAAGFVIPFTATNPNTNFVELRFLDFAFANSLVLLFQTSLSSFDGSTFYTGLITFPGGSTASSVTCAGFSAGPCSLPVVSYASGFVSGAATPATPAQTPVPEPASLTLLGLGLAGMGVRRWRQRKVS